MNRMLGYLKGYKRESVLAPLFKMLEATFDLFVPLVMADIVMWALQRTTCIIFWCGAAFCCCWLSSALPAA